MAERHRAHGLLPQRPALAGTVQQKLAAHMVGSLFAHLSPPLT